VGLLPQGIVAVDTVVPRSITPGSAAITSTCRSPLFERNIALGFVHADDAYLGSSVRLAGGAHARVARLPFYDPARSLPRRA
jgi:glycine cleavage system aminomethyltransferase T